MPFAASSSSIIISQPQFHKCPPKHLISEVTFDPREGAILYIASAIFEDPSSILPAPTHSPSQFDDYLAP